MTGRSLLHPILDDEAWARRLGDAEARLLVEWLVDQAERLVRDAPPPLAAERVGRLRRRGRALACFVSLWCHERRPGAAAQLAAVERFAWPLPDGDVEPCELMQAIVDHETAVVAAWAERGAA